jgi:hypothetical protein
MADAHESGATARPPSEPAEDRILRFPKEKRRPSLHSRAGAGLHRSFISQGIEMPTKPRSAAKGPEQEHRFELGGYYLERTHPEHLGHWYACRYDSGTRQVRRRSLKTTDFEEAKVRLAALVASAPSSANRIGPPGPDQVLSVAASRRISTNAAHTLHQRMQPSGQSSCSRTISPVSARSMHLSRSGRQPASSSWPNGA